MNPDMRILFTARYYNDEKEFIWRSSHGGDVREEFIEGLKALWPDLKLPSHGDLSFVITDEAIELRCGKPLVINGVSVRNRRLKTGDRIILGPLRLFYVSAEPVPEPGEIEARRAITPDIYFNQALSTLSPILKIVRRKYFIPAALLIAASAAAITVGCIAIPRISETEEPMPRQRTAETISEPETTIPAETLPSTVAESALRENRVAVVLPGAPVPEVDLDILFIHAHPDDESLDFGGLMALADAAGLKTGLVTFTDGESGLDTFPDRPVTAPYPAHSMEGTELAAVRSGELVRAAGVLGVDLLIRLGLPNHPYNTVKDELTPNAVIESWGGKENLTDIMLNILNKTSPETIAAPEAPGRAREHFEHEAVGFLSSEIMKKFPILDIDTPIRFITCIDPRQKRLYPESAGVNAGLKVEYSSLQGREISLRDIQLAALSMHKTQNDAVNVGTGFLPEYPAEYYKIQYWQTSQSWTEWIRSLH